MRDAAKLAQRHEVVLHIFDARLDPPLLPRILNRTGVDPERVSEGQIGVRALHGRLVVAGARDGGLEVIDPNLARYAIEPLEGMAVAGQPGLDRLVAHDLGVLVAAPGERAHEDPGLEGLSGVRVGNAGTHAEVDLCHVGHGKLEFDGSRWLFGQCLIQEAIDGVDAAGVAVLLEERPAHRRGVDALGMPLEQLGAIGIDTRDLPRRRACALQELGDRRVVRHGDERIEPALLACQVADAGHSVSADPLGTRHLADRLTQAQPQNDLLDLIHLEPPVSHRVPPGKSRKVTRSRSPRPLQQQDCGPIKPRIVWHH